MNKRRVGFITAVCYYAIAVVISGVSLACSNLGDWIRKTLSAGFADSILMLIIVSTLCLPSPMIGIGFLVTRKWRALHGWLMGLALTVIFTVGVLILQAIALSQEDLP